jgi:hypothetical protein
MTTEPKSNEAKARVVEWASRHAGGVAFAPVEANTGPLENRPRAVCLKDFHFLKRFVDHHT